MRQTITFIVTQDCQLKCKYCYLVGKNHREEMSEKTALQVVDYVLRHPTDFNTDEEIVFDFIGGEPLLRIDLIDNVCAYITKRMGEENNPWQGKYSFRITTNGILYGSPAVQQFINTYHNKLYVTISLDGTEDKHDASRVYPNGKGSYNDIIKNVPLWLQQFPETSTKVIVSSENVSYVKESIIHLCDLGIKYIDVNPVLEAGWKEGDDTIFEQQLIALADYIIEHYLTEDHQIGCFNIQIGKKLSLEEEAQWCDLSNTLCVDANGFFYPCIRFAKFSLRDKQPWSVGSLEHGIDKNKMRPFFLLDRVSQSPQKCLDCEVASGCGWCPAENYDSADTHTLYQRGTAVCKMHKARVRANNYYWNKLAYKYNHQND